MKTVSCSFVVYVVQRFRDKRELIDRINMYRDKIK